MVIDIRYDAAPFDFKRPETLEEQLTRHLTMTPTNLLSVVSGAHAMVAIVDFNHKTIEFYEPNGPYTAWVPAVSNFVYSYFARQPEFSGFRYIEPWEDSYCPYYGLQSMTQDRKCGNWASLYAALRVTCPHISRGSLVEMLRLKGPTYLSNLMDHWDCYMRAYLQNIGYVDAVQRLYRADRQTRELVETGYETITAELIRLYDEMVTAYYNDAYPTLIQLADQYDAVYDRYRQAGAPTEEFTLNLGRTDWSEHQPLHSALIRHNLA